MIQTRAGFWMCKVCSATWGRDLSTSKSGMSLFDTIGFVGFSWVSPTRWGPLSPLKAAGPWPLQRRPAELFSAPALRDPPLVPPTSTIPFSCRDNFIHPVHHCIQLNAETMLTLEWIELACVHVLTPANKGRCDVFIFSISTENAPPWSFSYPPQAGQL